MLSYLDDHKGSSDFDILHLFGKDILDDIQKRLAKVTHLGFVTVNYRGEPITECTEFCDFCKCFRNNEELQKNCSVSDAMSSIQAAITEKPCIYLCPCGLIEIAIPIIVNGSYLGGFLCGQARCSNPPDDILKMKPSSDLDVFHNALMEANCYLEELPIFPYERMTDIAELVSMIITMLCENKIQQLKKETELKHQLSRIHFQQVQTIHFSRLLQNADYLESKQYISDMLIEIYQLYARDSDLLINTFSDLIESVACTVCPAHFSEIQKLYPLPTGDIMNQNAVKCWLLQIMDFIMRKLAEMQYPILKNIFPYINQHIEESINLSQIVKECNISQGYLSKLFRLCFHLSVTDYIHLRKILVAKRMLSIPGNSMADIAFKLGYSDYSHFSRIFKKYEGITPKEYRNSLSE